MRQLLAKILYCNIYDLDNVLLHIPVGFVTVAIALYSGWLGLAFAYGFVTYETTQRQVIKDKCFTDIQGWLYGIAWAAIIGLLIRTLR